MYMATVNCAATRMSFKVYIIKARELHIANYALYLRKLLLRMTQMDLCTLCSWFYARYQ